jgi:hypothetical protein
MNVFEFGRVYQSYSFFKLLRLKSFFLICRFPVLTKNLGKIYRSFTNIAGPRITNNLLKKVYGDIFIGGENLKELELSLLAVKQEGLSTITDYAREFLTKEEEITEIDKIIKVYKDSIDSAVKIDNDNSVAIKISSFGNYETMQKLNSIQNILMIIEENLMENKTFEEIQSVLKSSKTDIIPNQEEIEQIKSLLHGQIKNFDLNLYEILKNPNSEQNQNLIKVITSMFNLSPEALSEYKLYVEKLDSRLSDVFSHALSKNCTIMIDAEQSYLQVFIDYLAMSYFKFMNKENCILMTTLQCYLKKEPENLNKIFSFCREKNITVGIKLVRGAYMNEENKLSNKKGVDSPLNSNIESTHENYTKSIHYIFENFKEKDRVIILIIILILSLIFV